MLHGPPEADGPAPVVDRQRDVSKFEVVDQGRQIRDMGGESVGIVLRLVGKPAPHVIRGHDAITVAQTFDQVTIIKRPGRVAVQHEHDGTGTFVDIMQAPTFHGQVVRFERVKRFQVSQHQRHAGYHRTPSMTELSPLPMPSIAMRVPGSGGSRSMPMAIVSGNDTEPTFPRNSKVEKSCAGFSPIAS